MTLYGVGVDCAVQHRKIGLALGRIEPAGVRLVEVVTGLDDVAPVLMSWTRQFEPKIYALDAPLGWPDALGRSLHGHEAGSGIGPDSNALFRRITDDFVYAKLGKRPLEVGADRIARTAVAALKVLEGLRSATGQALPLLGSPGSPDSPGVIEVYPAATLLTRGISIRGYKGNKPPSRSAREALIECLKPHMDLSVDHESLKATDHALDAAVCVLAAADFAAGTVFRPEGLNQDAIRKEGWIWFADRSSILSRAEPHARALRPK